MTEKVYGSLFIIIHLSNRIFYRTYTFLKTIHNKYKKKTHNKPPFSLDTSFIKAKYLFAPLSYIWGHAIYVFGFIFYV